METLTHLWRSSGTRWALLALVGLLLGLDYYHLSIFPRGEVDVAAVGDLATWATGVSTAAAVVVAGAGLRRERIKAQEDLARQDREASGQVYAWIEARRLRPGSPERVLILSNQTRLPIYDWKVTFVDTPSLSLDGTALGPIVPGERAISLETLDLPSLRQNAILRPIISFKSRLGSHLERGPEGALTEAASK